MGFLGFRSICVGCLGKLAVCLLVEVGTLAAYCASEVLSSDCHLLTSALILVLKASVAVE